MKCFTKGTSDAEKVVALGTFDGVHLGHQTVLEVAQTIAMVEGLTACGVLWGFRSRDVLLEGGAQVLCADAEELLRCILDTEI